MAAPGNNAVNFGQYVPTTNIWDTDQIHRLEEESDQLKELLIRLYQNLNRMSLALNLKETGVFDLNEFVTGEVWFPNPAGMDQQQFAINRSVRRTVLYGPSVGALPNAGTLTIPHNIACSTSTTITKFYAVATNPVSTFKYIPIPYSSVSNLNKNIEMYADGTNVYIVTASDYSAYTISYVVLEYLQI